MEIVEMIVRPPYGCSDDQIIREIRNPHIRESRMLALVRPWMQAAGLQCLELQIAVASPDLQTRAFPGTQVSQKTGHPNSNTCVLYCSL